MAGAVGHLAQLGGASQGFPRIMSRAMRPLLSLSLAVLLVGCRPLVPLMAHTDPLNTAGPPPDVVVLAMSGRCGPPCRAPRDNWDYLSSRGTLDAVAGAIAAQGYTVQVAGYADNALESFQPLKVSTTQRGYAALAKDFARIKAAWLNSGGPEPLPADQLAQRPSVQGKLTQSKPHQPRIVLLGHSHGSVWLHYLAQTNPDVPFALQIDLDGICASWNLDHGVDLAAHPVEQKGQPKAIDACDLRRIGNGQMRGKDIVWPNVAIDLEVQSKRLPSGLSDSGGFYINYLFEVTPNMRPDGTTTGIERYISWREDHSAVTYPNSDAMKWVLRRTAEIAAGWKLQDRNRINE